MRLAANIARVADSRVQNLHAPAAITMQSRQCIEITLGDQIFE